MFWSIDHHFLSGCKELKKRDVKKISRGSKKRLKTGNTLPMSGEETALYMYLLFVFVLTLVSIAYKILAVKVMLKNIVVIYCDPRCLLEFVC